MAERLKRRMPWLCRFGFHSILEGNCLNCGYRWHGKHAEPYKSWRSERGRG